MKVDNSYHCMGCEKTVMVDWCPEPGDLVTEVRPECADHMDVEWKSIQEITHGKTENMQFCEALSAYVRVFGYQFANGWNQPHTHSVHFKFDNGRIATLVVESVSSVHLVWERCPHTPQFAHAGSTLDEWLTHSILGPGETVIVFE